MKINEFITEYSEARDKEQCMKMHIVKRYVPYEQKMAICKNIIESADYTPNINIVDKKYYCPNTPMRFVLFCISLIDTYTDIELEEYDNGRNVMGGFNQLDSNGVFEIFFKELDKEYNIMTTVLHMMVDDYEKKENSIISFLDTKLEIFKKVYNTALPIIENNIVNFPNKEN